MEDARFVKSRWGLSGLQILHMKWWSEGVGAMLITQIQDQIFRLFKKKKTGKKKRGISGASSRAPVRECLSHYAY